MEEIVNFPELQSKLMQLPCKSRKNFIDILHKVYEDESRDMVDMLGKSRNEIQDMAEFIQKEQKALKETLQELKNQRVGSERNAESRMSTVSCTDGVANGGRKKRKNRNASGSRPASARSLPTAMNNTHVTIEEEKETVFRNLDTAGAKLDEERRRQAARVEELKEMKRQKQTNNASKARELMSEADNLNKMLDKSKVQQQEKVMEKVQERKKKKREEGNTPEIQTIHVEPAYSGGDGGGATGLSSNTWNTEMHI